jgi:hypothetical protein
VGEISADEDREVLPWAMNSQLPSLSDNVIYRQWPRTTQDKGSEAGEVQEVSFIAGLTKSSSSRRHR